MIRVTISPTGMRISGHAGAAPYGYDIVCAAVSALVQTFKAGAEDFTDDSLVTLRDAQTDQITGFTWERPPTERLSLLIDTLWRGLTMIEHEYPEYVKTEM